MRYSLRMVALRLMARGLAAVLIGFGAFMTLGATLSEKPLPLHVAVLVALAAVLAPFWAGYRLAAWAGEGRAPEGLGPVLAAAGALATLRALGLRGPALVLGVGAACALFALRGRLSGLLPGLPGLGTLWKRAGERVRQKPPSLLVQSCVLLFVELPESLSRRPR